MFTPAIPQNNRSASTPARLNFLRLLETHAIRPAARDYYVRWAEAWVKARGRTGGEGRGRSLRSLKRAGAKVTYTPVYAIYAPGCQSLLTPGN